MTDDTEPAAAQTRRRDIPLAVISVGMAIVVWWPAFTLGAWGQLFFDTLLTLWVASTAAFVFGVFERRRRQPLVAGVPCFLPTVWLASSFVDIETTDIVAFLATVFAFAVVLIASPHRVGARPDLWPDFEQDSTPRQRGSSSAWSRHSGSRRSSQASTRSTS